VLLDPLEERFHLPSAPVQGADGRCWQGKLVGQEHQVLAGLRIAIADASQLAWVVLGGIEAVKGDGLVADESCVAIHRRRIQASCIEVLLGARDEEASHLIERIEPLEVQVTPIHDVEGAASISSRSSTLTSCILPSEMWMKVGIDPRRSSSVCNLTAALVERNGAHGNIDRHRSMVVASRAYTVLASSRPKASSTIEANAHRRRARGP